MIAFFVGSLTLRQMKVRFVFFVCFLSVCVAAPGLIGQTFTNGQNANGVLGQTSFTGGTASNLSNRLNGPNGVAIDPTTGKIFVADRNNNRVLRYSSAATAQIGANPENVIGQGNFTNNLANQGLGAPTSRTLSGPRDVFVDGQGRLWVADGGNNRVLRYDNASFLGIEPPASAVLGQVTFTTAAAGTTAATMSLPFSVELGNNDELWVVDRSNHRVLRFDTVTNKANGAAADRVLGQALFTTSANPAASATSLNDPLSVDVDGNGRLWIADSTNHRVLGFDNAASILANGVSADAVLGQANFNSGQFNRGLALPTAATLGSPSGVYADPAGNLWVSEFNNSRVLRYNTAASKVDGGDADLVLGQANFTSAVATVAINRTNGPIQVSAGPDGSILIPDFNGNRVLRFDPINVAPTITLTGTSRRSTKKSSITLSGFAADSDGTLASVKATVNNKPAAVSGTTGWSLRARLKPGRNLITLRSEDNLGLLSSGVVTVTVTRK